jgi:hypothetical protein
LERSSKLPDWVHDEWTRGLPDEVRIPYFLAREVVYHLGNIPVFLGDEDEERDTEGLAKHLLRLRECVDELKSSLSKENWRFNAVNDQQLTFTLPHWGVPLVESNAHALVAEIGQSVAWQYIRTILNLEHPDWVSTRNHNAPITTEMVTNHFDRLSECIVDLGGIDTYDTLWGRLDQEIAKVFSRLRKDSHQPIHATNGKNDGKQGGKIAPEDRTIPMSYRRAAKLMGKGNSKDAAEWLAALVKDGSIPCERLTRQTHVFSKRSFHKDVWHQILPHSPETDGK